MYLMFATVTASSTSDWSRHGGLIARLPCRWEVVGHRRLSGTRCTRSLVANRDQSPCRISPWKRLAVEPKLCAPALHKFPTHATITHKLPYVSHSWRYIAKPSWPASPYLTWKKNPGKHDIENIMSAQTERENETNNIAREKSCECLTCSATTQAIKTTRKPICAVQNREENDEERLYYVHRHTQSIVALQRLASRQI
jgi:hypothetical protein